MFRGVQFINMDAKGRLAMPAKHREQLSAECEGHLVATINTQSSCLSIYPFPVWEVIEKEVQDLPSMRPEVARFQRMLIGHASEMELDANGMELIVIRLCPAWRLCLATACSNNGRLVMTSR